VSDAVRSDIIGDAAIVSIALQLGQYLKGTQHRFCPQTQNTTGRRSVHLKGTQHRFWVLRIFAHKHGLREKFGGKSLPQKSVKRRNGSDIFSSRPSTAVQMILL
jgi:hypothetical protein